MYGLDLNDFFHEVALRAKNNYGSWSTQEEAGQKIERAIDDVMADLQEAMHTEYQRIDDIECEMCNMTEIEFIDPMEGK